MGSHQFCPAIAWYVALSLGMLLFLRICLRQYQRNIAWFLSTRDLPKQAWHNIWPRVSLCQQLDWSVYLLLYIFQTQPSICTYLHVTCHNSFHVNIREFNNNINSVVGSTHSFLKVTNWFRFYKKSSVTHFQLFPFLSGLPVDCFVGQDMAWPSWNWIQE